MQQIAFNYRYYERWEIRKTSPTISNQHQLFGTKGIRPITRGYWVITQGYCAISVPYFAISVPYLIIRVGCCRACVIRSDNLFGCLSFVTTLVSQKENSVFNNGKHCFPYWKTIFSNQLSISFPFLLLGNGGRWLE